MFGENTIAMERFNFYIIVLSAVFALACTQKCYNLTCTGSGCLQQEVTFNPLLIPKCERIFYRGCFIVTTTTSGFTTTTAGCIGRGFECVVGTCSGVTVKAEVTCCNSDLCNDGKPASSVSKPTYGTSLVLQLLVVAFTAWTFI